MFLYLFIKIVFEKVFKNVKDFVFIVLLYFILGKKMMKIFKN